MLSKIVFVALILLCFVKEANAQNKNINKISDKYYHLIEAPTSAYKWDEWRLFLRIWRDSTLKFINYKGDNYQNDHYKWSSKGYFEIKINIII